MDFGLILDVLLTRINVREKHIRVRFCGHVKKFFTLRQFVLELQFLVLSLLSLFVGSLPQ